MFTPPDLQRAEPPPPIFICYRRDDTAARALHLYYDLTQRFGARSVFMDINSIAPGGLWRLYCEDASLTCRVMLVAIGPQWLKVTDPTTGCRRLDDPGDVLRGEVARALARRTRVVPVLLDGASMPHKADLPDNLKPLADRNAYRISAEHWAENVAELIASFEDEAHIRPHVTVQPETMRGAYATPMAGATPLMFAVNPEARDVLIVLVVAATLVIVVCVMCKSHGWGSA